MSGCPIQDSFRSKQLDILQSVLSMFVNYHRISLWCYRKLAISYSSLRKHLFFAVYRIGQRYA